jgi:hypothetical protein
MGKLLGIVYRAISAHLINKAGYSLKECATGAVTLIQRFGWYGIPAALNRNLLCGAPHKIFHVKSCVMWSNTFSPPRLSQYWLPEAFNREDYCT